MADTIVPARVPQPVAPERATQLAEREQAPLDELMLAMDVVDTLRHRELVVARELSEEDRERELMQRLREIYTGQGIEVSDDILAQGVRALREDRFVYSGPEPGFARTLARLYVSRGRWGKPLLAVLGVVAAGLLGYQLLVRGPELRSIEQLPGQLQAAQQSVAALTTDSRAIDEATELLGVGQAALAQKNYDEARGAVASLHGLQAKLEQQYELRIVSRPGERSGVWRVPDDNRNARNYYLIVEALTPSGKALTLPIQNEEDGRTYNVDKWGLRVDQSTYEAIARDKQDDGIIQRSTVGAKRRGALDPEYAVSTSGATITKW
jgi:hypothetical protein